MPNGSPTAGCSTRVGCLAARLAGLGVGAEDRVGLFTEPSTELMTGVWGILTAGAAYLPLSPDYPEDRLRYMIEDSGTRVIVTQDRLRDRLAALAPAGTVIVTPADAPVTGTAAAHPSAATAALAGPPPRRPTTWRTSSTPRAAPAGPRGC
ncbi:AMP-binding protein [Streptomyces sp. UP1A-1]|nr:AMP-binding protein [Streptomyces sp. UP1A-1]